MTCIVCCGSGGVGTAAITKSLTVDAAPGVLAFNAGTINVNIAATDTVTLRGLVLNGSVFGDSEGSHFGTGGNLNVEKCDISGFTNSGIVQPGAGSNLRVTGSASTRR